MQRERYACLECPAFYKCGQGNISATAGGWENVTVDGQDLTLCIPRQAAGAFKAMKQYAYHCLATPRGENDCRHGRLYRQRAQMVPEVKRKMITYRNPYEILCPGDLVFYLDESGGAVVPAIVLEVCDGWLETDVGILDFDDYGYMWWLTQKVAMEKVRR